jgi:hypothetical protein
MSCRGGPPPSDWHLTCHRHPSGPGTPVWNEAAAGLTPVFPARRQGPIFLGSQRLEQQ